MTPRRRARLGRTIAACSIGSAGVFAATPAFTFSCSAPLHPMQRIELMFGRNIRGHAGVGETAWSRFLAREITPRFPDGLTVVDAAGQWRDRAAGRLAREPSKLVIIVTAGDPSADEKVAAIIAAYKERFHQKSVGVAASPVCAAF